MANVQPIQKHTYNSEEILFLDANIWLFIYSPRFINNKKQHLYSREFDRILKAKSMIYIDVLVMSEFINRYCRLEFDWAKQHYSFSSFKEFRKSPAFTPVAKDVSNSIKRILNHSNIIESGFNKIGTEALIEKLESGTCEFNDLILAEICKTNGFLFITHDADFINFDINIFHFSTFLFTKHQIH